MDEPSPLVLGEPNEERVAWLKRLRQRRGLNQPVKGVPFKLFGAHDWESLLVQFVHVRRLAPPLPPVEALYAALGKTESFYAPYDPDMWDLPTVIDRRRSLARAWGKSVRTLERLEEEGALILDFYFSEMLDDGYAIRELARINEKFDAVKWWMVQRDLVVPDEVWEKVKYDAQQRLFQAVSLYTNGFVESAKVVAAHGVEADTPDLRKHRRTDV